jgi:multidrug efflux system outer membrane protein
MLSTKKNSYQPYLWTLLLVACLASCKVQQEYHRPELQLPAQFSDNNNTDTNSIANLKWNQFFTDTTLQGLIRKGLLYNYDLQIALRNISAANEQVKQAKTLELPQVGVQVAAQIDRPSDNSLNGITAQSFLNQSDLNDYNASIGISWEADIWGKIRMQKQATIAQYLQTYEAAQAIQTRLISDIAQGYYNLLMLDAQLAVAENNLRLSDTTLLLTRLQRDAGNATGLAVEQAEAQKQATAILIPSLQQSIALQEHALSILTGDLPNTIQRNVQLNQINMPDSLAVGIPVAMVSRRPDVHAAELGLIVANKEVGVAKANMYPSLNITAQGGLDAFKTSNWFNIPGALFGIVTGTVAQPLFEHRTLKTKYKVAEIQREQSVLQFRQSVLNAVGEVADALTKEEKLKEQQQITSARVDTLHAAIHNAQLLFRSDMATYLEVITAQSNALQAELDLASVQRLRLSAAIDLYRALGGGRE